MSDFLRVTEVEAQPARFSQGPEIAFEAYGVALGIATSRADVLEEMHQYLPPGWTPCDPAQVERQFEIFEEPDHSFTLAWDGRRQSVGLNQEISVLLLETELRLYIARKSPVGIFVHAGVVEYGGKAIVLPGLSFSGKTRLVAALVRAGATYYSDEFAVLDPEGLVHPYPKPLSIRDDKQIQTDIPVESFGGTAGEAAAPAGLVAITTFKPGAEWNPQRLSPGQGAMAMLANTVPARERPEESLSAVKNAVANAVVLESERGEAEPLVPVLLAELERA
jgi:hypothetical protein